MSNESNETTTAEGTEQEQKSLVPEVDLSPMEFVVELKERAVTLHLPKGGGVLKCVLRELDGVDRDKYLNLLGGRMKMVNGKPAGVRDCTDLQADLVFRSLFDTEKTDNKGEYQHVPLSVIKALPASIQTKLFTAARQLSALDDDAADRAKNE